MTCEARLPFDRAQSGRAYLPDSVTPRGAGASQLLMMGQLGIRVTRWGIPLTVRGYLRVLTQKAEVNTVRC